MSYLPDLSDGSASLNACDTPEIGGWDFPQPFSTPRDPEEVLSVENYSPPTGFTQSLPTPSASLGTSSSGDTPQDPPRTFFEGPSAETSNLHSVSLTSSFTAPLALSHNDVQLSNVFLDWLHDKEPESPAFDTVIAKRGYKLVPIKQPVAQKKRKRAITEMESARKAKKKYTPKSQQWWHRFLKITGRDLHMSLDESHSFYMERPDALLAAFTHDGLAETLLKDDSEVDTFGRTVLYTLSLDRVEFHTSVMHIVMRLTYFVLGQTKANNVLAASTFHPTDQDENWTFYRLAKIGSRELAGLYHDLKPDLPGRIADEDTFIKELQVWRKDGAAYAFLAQHLGLGALILLRHQIRRLWGCSKGGEHSGISADALDHLKELGIAEMAASAGADGLMHHLLWRVCATFPGFGTRQGMEPFPGFEYKGEPADSFEVPEGDEKIVIGSSSEDEGKEVST